MRRWKSNLRSSLAGPVTKWVIGGHPGSIEFPTGLCEEILVQAPRNSWPAPAEGSKLGGVLMGGRSGKKLQIRAIRPVLCERPENQASGPPVGGQEALSKLLDEAVLEHDLAGMTVLGCYFTKDRWTVLTPADRAIYDLYFPEPWQVALVLVPQQEQSCLAGFFYRQRDGSVWISRSEIWVGSVMSQALPRPLGRATDRGAVPSEALVTLALNAGACRGSEAEASPLAAESATALVPNEALAAPQLLEAPAGPAMPPEDANCPVVQVTRSEADLPPPGDARALPRPSSSTPKFDPFLQTGQSGDLYWGRRRERVLGELLRSIRNRCGLIVLTGEGGTGKTSLLLRLGDFLVEDSVEFALLPNAAFTCERFYELLAVDLDLRCEQYSKENVLHALLNLLLRRAKENRTVALFADEAHRFPPNVLEEIRQLDKLEDRGGKLLQTVLCGSPELDCVLEEEGQRTLKQQVALWRRLQPLTEEETADYILYQLARAGVEAQTSFPPEVLRGIHFRSAGLFRLVNAVCSRLLQICHSGADGEVTLEMLRQACVELGLEPRAPEGSIAVAGTEPDWSENLTR
jgi:general secretion pathway protein A